MPAQGEIWWAESLDKRRPVLIVTRSAAAAVLHSLVVAPISRTVRNIPTEIGLNSSHGLSIGCAASFDNLQAVNRPYLTKRVGRLKQSERGEICRALGALADC